MMKEYMIRPVIYKCVTRCALAITALLLWDRTINAGGQLSLVRDGCFTAGAFFAAWAWFSYLKLDGVKLHHLLEERKRKKKPVRRGTSDIVDFADEHIISFEELTDQERNICSLSANLICFALFMVVSAVGFLTAPSAAEGRSLTMTAWAAEVSEESEAVGQNPAREGVPAYPLRAYEHFETEALEAALNTLEGAWEQNGQEDVICQGYRTLMEEFDLLGTMYGLAQIDYDRDVSREDTKAELTYIQEIYRLFSDRAYLTLKAGMNSGYEELLKELIGDEDMAEGLRYYEGTPETVLELLEEEDRLMLDYDLLAAEDVKAEIEGEEWSYDRLSRDVELYSEKYYEVKEVLDQKKNQVLGEHFLKLLKLRAGIAEEDGYKDYRDYAYSSLYGRDYSYIDTAGLFEEVKETMVPLYDDLYWNIELPEEEYDRLERLGEAEDNVLLEQCGEITAIINADLGEIFQYMERQKLYDIGSEETKNRSQTTYTIGLPSYRDGFIFLNRSGSYQDYQGMFHEFGHFTAEYYEEKPELYRISYTDISELQSQTMELLAASAGEELLGEAYAYESVNTALDTVVLSCLVGEFEEAVYEDPDITLEEMNRLFARLQDEYGNWYVEDYEGQCYEWVDIPHLFHMPFYYISYGTSALSALDIWSLSQEDPEAGTQLYLDLLKNGSGLPYRESVYHNGLLNIFDSGDLKELSGRIRDIWDLEVQEEAGSETQEEIVLNGNGGLYIGMAVMIFFQLLILAVTVAVFVVVLVKRDRRQDY